MVDNGSVSVVEPPGGGRAVMNRLITGARTRMQGAARPVALYVSTLLIVVATFGIYHDRWLGTAKFQVPVQYEEDALAMLGIFKGFASLPAPWNLTVPTLNAPFGADWNDYPHTEKLLYYFAGILNRLFDAGTASNLVMLWAHIGAAWAFVWVARRFDYDEVIAVAGGLLFSFSPYVLWRSLAHINLGYVWHLPLLLYLVIELEKIGQRPLRSRATLVAGLLVACAAFQHPYYPMLLFQLLGLSSLRCLARGSLQSARFGGIILGIGVLSMVLNQSNVFLRSLRAGANTSFAGRSLPELINWGLRVPDLFFPVRYPIEPIQEFAADHYFHAGNTVSENYMAFLGVLGCALLVAIVATSVWVGLNNRFSDIPGEAWLILYVLVFSLVGGLNYMLGAFGFTWLRCTNRYSIVVLCLLLLWGCRLLQSQSRERRSAWSVGIAALGLAEAFGLRLEPAVRVAQVTRFTQMATSDKKFAQSLEDELKPGGAVFQLPVTGFPEAGPIEGMLDYEHFRPILWTDELRFSYGAHRGRPREGWQRFVEALEPAQMVEYLEQHGFDAIMVNRRGYADRGGALAAGFKALGIEPLLEADAKDLVAYALKQKSAKLPSEYATIALGTGWWGWERNETDRWSWSKGSATLRAVATPGRAYEITFSVEAQRERQVVAYSGGVKLASAPIKVGEPARLTFRIRARSTETIIELQTDQPAEQTQPADPRAFAFRITNPEIKTAPLPQRHPGAKKRGE
jgi:phosphoglycerol transferase